MFHYDRGLKLTSIDLAIDICRRQPRGFISHAHSDHIGKHELAFCTPETALLYRYRAGGARRVKALPYRQTVEFGDTRLTTYPAGHILGSAMLLAERKGQTLLYTGDFKLGPSATAAPAELPQADILVMECTFGRPEYRLPPREESIALLLEMVSDAFDRSLTPVVEAYTLGKAQEVTKILTNHGIPVLQHPRIFAVSKLYEQCGCSLGDYELYPGEALPGHVVITPPRSQRTAPLEKLGRKITIGVSGWAHCFATRQRLGTQLAVPLSDHADYEELFAAVRQVSPAVVYCTHGPESFADDLRAAGFNAQLLNGKAHQMRLF